jgi:hypothetical protein
MQRDTPRSSSKTCGVDIDLRKFATRSMSRNCSIGLTF